ncbi:MAG: WD40 repeat domain-containing serine/threonine protein kinase, partial [Archangium sp.]
MSDKDELGKTLPRSIPGRSPGPGGAREVLPQHDDARYALADGEVDPELGRGGMGRVLKLVDTNLRREVAVKELLREHTAEHSSSGPMLEELFVREARVLALLEHPGVVPVYELGRRSDGTPYYVMRRIHGRSLSSVLDHAVSLDERLSMLSHLIDVVNTVGYAHSKRVVHRDLKPENVMVGPFGETQVIDWGLAMVNGEMTPGSELAGTPAYMAPEQANGVGVDARSDVWALGVMLFELLTGKRPFDATSATQVLDNVRSAPIPTVKSLEPKAPRELMAIVDRALQRAPSLRFQNAGEMAEALEAAQRSRAPTSRGLLIGVIALALTCAALLFVAGDARQRVEDAQGRAQRVVADTRRENAQNTAEAALTAWRARDAAKASRLAKTVSDNPLAAGIELLVSEAGAPEQAWTVTVPAGCSSLASVGTSVACATLNGITLFGADGKQLGEFSTGPVGWQHAVLMLGDQLVSGGDDTLLRFWNVETRKEVRNVNGFATGIRALATDGTDVLVGLADGSVLRVIPDGTVREVTKHPRPILWLAATPGQVTSVSDSLLRVSGPSPMELDRHVGAVAYVNARDLMFGVERTVVLVRDGDVKMVSSGHRDDVTALTHVDGRVVSGSADGTIRWWFEDGSLEGTLDGFAPGVTALAADASRVFVATSNRKLEAWSLPARVAVPTETAVPSAYEWWAGAGLVTGYRDGRLVRTDGDDAHVLEARHFGPVRGIARVTGEETSDAVRFISG